MARDTASVLICPPDFYAVEYIINPWMEGNVHRASHDLAQEQWRAFTSRLQAAAELQTVPPQPALPDMVFTANAGLVLGRDVVLSRFLHRERRGEEPHFHKWFASHGYKVHELPRDLPFEGAGDALWDRARGLVWAAYGMRTELESHPHLARLLGAEVVSLRLIDRRFYHLDTCFCPLENGRLLYYPAAFDAYSNRVIESRVPPEQRIAVGENDAINFACNAVNIGKTIFLNRASDELKAQLAASGLDVVETPLSEFLKSGGGAKCLTLRLDEPLLPAPATAAAAAAATPAARPGAAPRGGFSTVESRVLHMEGHLLDSGLLDRALETSVSGGGSFRILSFDLGKQRQSTSKASICVSAPASELLDNITAQLIDLGAVLPSEDESDAELQAVAQDGVAPEEFYVTTIYPTEVRVGGKWLRVEEQRMDGVVAIADGHARCTLIRDLRAGTHVITGTRGIRTVRKAEARDGRAGTEKKPEEFSFMGAGVSSERRVELVVERIAWELRRIRARGGKVVVVPGPVVIHTGAGVHLAQLVREGYVGALLGGNAIAVHDIEQAMLGTSLGVDLQQGTPVHGGHQHHLRAINAIRRCGSIAAAVEGGVLKRGVFFECIKKGVPFALAGSIRDDGPLPDTQMDLLKAQADYARLIKGAEMILMLSTMLHAIGVGNMTPAGVKLVCVDINPAVVTKLADRGSLESIGVVTDVGLFLSLLVQRLDVLERAAVSAV